MKLPVSVNDIKSTSYFVYDTKKLLQIKKASDCL